ncbi:unnamed protein product [Gongylonema pulchrum]|uniref:Uncharacterized protein n=1 Tax=Gongylonema pulchrum TaxID=637853 RepID=A0A183EQ44_9BILA|nr:unnamed protein product [Gongylonema pulchrum]
MSPGPGNTYQNPANNAKSIDDILPSGSSSCDILSTHIAARIFHLLITMTDSIYERFGEELNLVSLCELIQSLVAASESRLQYSSSQPSSSLVDPTALLRRITTILVTLSKRPLIHAMKIWPKVTPHIVQVVF